MLCVATSYSLSEPIATCWCLRTNFREIWVNCNLFFTTKCNWKWHLRNVDLQCVTWDAMYVNSKGKFCSNIWTSRLTKNMPNILVRNHSTINCTFTWRVKWGVVWPVNHDILARLGQSHGCWCPGSLNRQVISSDGTKKIINKSLSSIQKDFKYLCHLSIERW